MLDPTRSILAFWFHQRTPRAQPRRCSTLFAGEYKVPNCPSHSTRLEPRLRRHPRAVGQTRCNPAPPHALARRRGRSIAPPCPRSVGRKLHCECLKLHRSGRFAPEPVPSAAVGAPAGLKRPQGELRASSTSLVRGGFQDPVNYWWLAWC